MALSTEGLRRLTKPSETLQLHKQRRRLDWARAVSPHWAGRCFKERMMNRFYLCLSLALFACGGSELAAPAPDAITDLNDTSDSLKVGSRELSGHWERSVECN